MMSRSYNYGVPEVGVRQFLNWRTVGFPQAPIVCLLKNEDITFCFR